MRVALVHDWLDTWGGSEAVLAELLRIYPQADVYTLVDFMRPEERARLAARRVVQSPLAGLPGARCWFRYAAVAWPQVVERFDLARYDLVISDSHAVAKGARRAPSAHHLCYCHTPARVAWTMREVYRERAAGGSRARRLVADALIRRFRRWDVATSRGVDRFVANSAHIARAILECYGREADVVHPPVDVARFAAAAVPGRGDYFVTVSRLVPYKRVDLLLEAFRALPAERLVVVGEGVDRARLERASPANVLWRGFLAEAELARTVASARAFVYVAEEDFGMALVEAQAAGLPVIAYGAGGAREIVRGLDSAEPTGVLFDHQTPQAIVSALGDFARAHERILPAACFRNAERFAAERFRSGLARSIACMLGEPAKATAMA